ncbi:hypothetical protein [Micromonospora qiuiae]|uniref:hypothetical protein n=1 Tax=Micromonospora qiuiae TaxID=502268 RepID=UPI0019511960|nr:hypothetical protein [Micromonospora qiuiae]
MTTVDEHHRRLPGGGFTCQRWGCTHVSGQPMVLEPDVAQEMTDVGQDPPADEVHRTPGQPPF